MIEFMGEIDSSNYAVIYKNLNKTTRLVMFVTWVIVCCPLFIIAVHLHNWGAWMCFGGFIILCTAMAVIFCIFPNIVIPKKDWRNNLPIRVTIEEDGIRRYGKNDIYAGREFDDVKKVIDWGNLYQFIFYFPHKDAMFFCQKNLIKEGTIEEFEKLFEGCIVRKIRLK